MLFIWVFNIGLLLRRVCTHVNNIENNSIKSNYILFQCIVETTILPYLLFFTYKTFYLSYNIFKIFKFLVPFQAFYYRLLYYQMQEQDEYQLTFL